MKQSDFPGKDSAQMTAPILYSFRRCPYAMRARLALIASGVRVEMREILLRQKPEEFLLASQSGTVPCIVTSDGAIDESLDIMLWALSQHDPEGWLEMPSIAQDWISRTDGPFKSALDRTKYASRYPDESLADNRASAAEFLSELDKQISGWMFARPTLADFSILPFVRQFALIDKSWFEAQPWPRLQDWLQNFLNSALFEQSMIRLPPWQKGDPQIFFPA